VARRGEKIARGREELDAKADRSQQAGESVADGSIVVDNEYGLKRLIHLSLWSTARIVVTCNAVDSYTSAARFEHGKPIVNRPRAEMRVV
jgi:hypothetical protein